MTGILAALWPVIRLILEAVLPVLFQERRYEVEAEMSKSDSDSCRRSDALDKWLHSQG